MKKPEKLRETQVCRTRGRGFCIKLFENYLIKIKTKKIGLLDMDKIDELYKLGYNEAKKQIKKLNL